MKLIFHSISTMSMLYLLLFSFQCCTDMTDDIQEPRLVVDGWIESGGYPTVILTTTASPTDEGVNVADCMVRWGKVTVSDGDTTVILTGGVNNRYFPPFVYQSLDMKGESGKTYTLTAEYKGMKVSAVTQIPSVTPIDSISVVPVEGNDSIRSTKVYLTPNNEAGNQYYKLRYRVFGSDPIIYSSFLGTISTCGNAEQTAIPLFRAKRLGTNKTYSKELVRGQYVEIRLCHIEEAVYNFWVDYDNVVTFGTMQMFQETTSVRSNIVGGYGAWCGYGVSSARFIVP